MRYYIVAGEHSGDMHGADLIIQLKKLDPAADFWACGGTAMEKAMGKPCCLYTTIVASMGLDFIEHIYKLWQWLTFCKQGLLRYQPDLLILIDFGSFNMRLASFAKQHGFPVYSYIPPKIWAYRKPRITRIQKNIKQIFSVLPFEVASYQAYGYNAIEYVGNPLVQKVARHVVNANFAAAHGLDKRPIIALLPGSRIDEVKRILPIMASQAAYFSSYQLVVAGLTHLPSLLYKAIPSSIRMVYDQTYDLLAIAQAAIVASGTATLETALWNVPQIVVYKVSCLTYCLYKRILSVPYISLVNLLLNRTAVPELIQDVLTEQQLYATLTELLIERVSTKQKAYYQELKQLLGSKEASVEIAQFLLQI
ncbi:lipid-A-disaccharide synthase [Candidatus Cardinium hertigii]|jgi:lipid-A-disaccharide synthase|uniref:Lipid-A-disaccharide synthase n=1 Tax=Candidatus Cardinium hertigii TaxID=247481 RepID=A0A3N2QDC9_9BACT|nr:lipid-A-disaccharide synthase [Candidatus Cardinium hertigii]ROT47669.1 lipid-A-disaccharide synthase [Candidatus Cardinium hertigii]